MPANKATAKSFNAKPSKAADPARAASSVEILRPNTRDKIMQPPMKITTPEVMVPINSGTLASMVRST
jgi:hypothetical protein